MASATKDNFIAGEWTAGSSKLAVRNPYDDRHVGSVSLATAAQVEVALAAAAAAFAVYRRVPSRLRAELLLRVRERVWGEQEKLAQLICAEAGKPIKFARGEVGRALETLLLSAEEARRLHGEYLPLDLVPGTEGYSGIVRRVPRGPAVALWPFNFPLNLLCHKLGPALAAGCPVIMRPPSATPLTGHRLAQHIAAVLAELDLPPATVQYLACAHDAAAPLIEDPRTACLSFTGSDTVGWELKRKAYKKQVLLELGGQASMIIEPDAPDLAYTAKRAALGAFAYAGQVCISVQRLLISKKIWDRFLPLLLAEVAALKTGDPRDEQVTVGPLIDDPAAQRIADWLAEAVSRGARVLAGERLGGRLFSPHVLERVKPDTQLGCNEAFGPLVTLEPYKQLDDAIALTNASRFGLQTGVFTSNVDKVQRAWRDIEVGGLIINDYPMLRVDSMPYGGVKDSGFGREGVAYAVQEYTEPRLLVLRGEA